MRKLRLTAAVMAAVLSFSLVSYAGIGAGGHDSGASFEFESYDNNARVSVKGTKTWIDDDNSQGLRPSEITVYLYADGEPTGDSYTLSEATNWTYEFTDVKKYSDDGEITYTIKEDVPDGYKVVYSTDE